MIPPTTWSASWGHLWESSLLYFYSCMQAVCVALTPSVEGCTALNEVYAVPQMGVELGSHCGYDFKAEISFLQCHDPASQGAARSRIRPLRGAEGAFHTWKSSPAPNQTRKCRVRSSTYKPFPLSRRESQGSHTFSFIIHLKALSLAPRLWLTLWVLGMKSLLLTYQFFISLKWKCLGLKGKICFEESFHKVITYNNYEHWMHNMKEHMC